jgi:uncharacterized protein (TIGR03435 family)
LQSRNHEAKALFTALQDKFGLRLESQRSASEVLVIDQVEKTPGGKLGPLQG